MSGTEFSDIFSGVQDALEDILGRGGRQRQPQQQQSAYDAYFMQPQWSPAQMYAPTAQGGALMQETGGGLGAPALWNPIAQQQSGYGAGTDPTNSAFLNWAMQPVPKAQDRERGLSGTAVEAGDWSGPATADDNATLTPEKIDSWIAATRPGSPLRGKGGYILQVANQYGVSAPLLMGIFLKESELGTTAGPGFNLAGVGGEGNFAQYGSWEQAIDGAARNLGGPTYKGKSAAEQVTTWYAGPQAWQQYGTRATDAGGGGAPSPNGSAQQYLDGPVSAAYGGLGVPLNATAAGTRKPTSARGDDTFPVVGWQGEIQNHWGTSERGATDIMAPSGTPIVAVRGGRVTWAGSDGLGGNNVLIHDDATGLDFYYAHMRDAPLVRAGQTVTAGAPLGYVGNTGDAAGGPTHLHLGIGYGIIQGGGASGGAGKGFDAVGFLQSIYGRGRSRGGGGQLTP